MCKIWICKMLEKKNSPRFQRLCEVSSRAMLLKCFQKLELCRHIDVLSASQRNKEHSKLSPSPRLNTNASKQFGWFAPVQGTLLGCIQDKVYNDHLNAAPIWISLRKFWSFIKDRCKVGIHIGPKIERDTNVKIWHEHVNFQLKIQKCFLTIEQKWSRVGRW